ncbi:hypothetical protein [Helicobacter brantae]|uniref:Uncharacterized protein n=1 Tax=Helicobacter brantae TaxID=375927 RepID=A0A3D8J4L8_9HELI|nr:hypothetical protein [Helicobacter brantae]RDU71824.1 hypothetical protein CQA58_01930 [Helicobacter brantae]
MEKLGLDGEVIDQCVNLIPFEKEGEEQVCKEICSEKLIQGGEHKIPSDMECIHIGVFRRILEGVATRVKPKIKTMRDMLELSDDVIERYQNDDIMGFYRTEYEDIDGFYDLRGEREGESYYQCHKFFVSTIVAQACMVAHIAHIYGYKMREENLARVLLVIRNLIVKECERQRVSYLAKEKMHQISGKILREIFANHHPEIEEFDVLHPDFMCGNYMFDCSLQEEVSRGIRREITMARRLSSERVFRF